MLVRHLAGGPFCCYFFDWEDYLPELREIGLDPAVQGVPFKKKPSVVTKLVRKVARTKNGTAVLLRIQD